MVITGDGELGFDPGEDACRSKQLKREIKEKKDEID